MRSRQGDQLEAAGRVGGTWAGPAVPSLRKGHGGWERSPAGLLGHTGAGHSSHWKLKPRLGLHNGEEQGGQPGPLLGGGWAEAEQGTPGP